MSDIQLVPTGVAVTGTKISILLDLEPFSGPSLPGPPPDFHITKRDKEGGYNLAHQGTAKILLQLFMRHFGIWGWRDIRRKLLISLYTFGLFYLIHKSG